VIYLNLVRKSMWKPFRAHHSPAIVPSCCLAVLLVLAGIRSLQQEPPSAIASQPPPEAVEVIEIPSFLWEPAPLRQQFSGLSRRHPLGESMTYKELEGKLREGDTLAAVLARLDVAKEVRQQIVAGFSCCLDLKRLRAGDSISLLLGPDGVLISCTFRVGPLESFTLTETSSGWTVAHDRTPVTSHTVKVSGTIGHPSLPDAFSEAGEKAELAHAFAEIFALMINMESELAEGDRFSLLVEKYFRDEQFIGYGKILMGRYERADSELLEAVYFEADKADGGYFTPTGKNLDTLFLIEPLPAARVTSSFALQRQHPILGRMRPHLGVDLAAPEGTPVLAAADGVVVFLGYNGGFGNQIVIEHAGGFRTHYGHLSRYHPDLKKGSLVRQEDTIGYVGSTGLATGPHLDYRLEHHGNFKNPLAAEHRIVRDLKQPDLFRMQLSAEIYAMFMESETGHQTLATRELNLAADSSLPLLQGAL
jgi:murein DD-endopeptidase MepM/ murein hydrolase activator NlpD